MLVLNVPQGRMTQLVVSLNNRDIEQTTFFPQRPNTKYLTAGGCVRTARQYLSTDGRILLERVVR